MTTNVRAKFVLCGPKHMVMQIVKTQKIKVDCLFDLFSQGDNNNDEIVLFVMYLPPKLPSSYMQPVYKCYNLKALQAFFNHKATNDFLPDTRVQLSAPDLARIKNNHLVTSAVADLAPALISLPSLPHSWRVPIGLTASEMDAVLEQSVTRDLDNAGYVHIFRYVGRGVLNDVPGRADLNGRVVRAVRKVYGTAPWAVRPGPWALRPGQEEEEWWVVIHTVTASYIPPYVEVLLVSDNNMNFIGRLLGPL